MAVVPGIYQLLVRLRSPKSVRIGGLGLRRLPAGWYIYTGSAKCGLEQRIGRHLGGQKRVHWHIDYLLAVADRAEAFVLPGTEVTECQLHARMSDGQVIVPGFGSSDCRCRSHLAWSPRKPKLELTPWTVFIQRRPAKQA